MEIVKVDVVAIGAGVAGLRAAIAAAESDPSLRVALLSKSYPMGGYKGASEAGAAGVVLSEDSLEQHAADTLAAGAGLSDRAAVDYFVANCTRELVQLGRWGCPWLRQPNGAPAPRREPGMAAARSWTSVNGTGYDVLDTLFHASLALRGILRFDDYFCLDLLVEDGVCQGVLALRVRTGTFVLLQARAVILATGGAGRVFRHGTGGGTFTADGMALAYRQGVALRDLEFVQRHPTCLPGSGVALARACRVEGALLLNRLGQRYLADPRTPGAAPQEGSLELGSDAALVHAFWLEQQAGRTLETPDGPAVLLDLRALGRPAIEARLPGLLDLVQRCSGIDASEQLVPVCPAVQYSMGGIAVDLQCATTLPGLYAAGECASVGLHGANRLGANALSESLVFGKVAGEQAVRRARLGNFAAGASLELLGLQIERRAQAQLGRDGGRERVPLLRRAMAQAMESGCGIYRSNEAMAATIGKLGELRARFQNLERSAGAARASGAWLAALELGYQLDVAEAMACSAASRAESRGAHQRSGVLAGYTDPRYAQHTLATCAGADAPHISYAAVGAPLVSRAVPLRGAA